MFVILLHLLRVANTLKVHPCHTILEFFKGLRSNRASHRNGRDRWGASRTLYHKSTLWWTERLWAAKAASWFPYADIDVSPPHDSGAENCSRRGTAIG